MPKPVEDRTPPAPRRRLLVRWAVILTFATAGTGAVLLGVEHVKDRRQRALRLADFYAKQERPLRSQIRSNERWSDFLARFDGATWGEWRTGALKVSPRHYRGFLSLPGYRIGTDGLVPTEPDDDSPAPSLRQRSDALDRTRKHVAELNALADHYARLMRAQERAAVNPFITPPLAPASPAGP